MPIIRRDKPSPFFSCSRSLAQDEKLSLEAVGLMAYLLSKPDDWKAQFKDIEKRGKLGRDARRRLFAELEHAGYFERRKMRGVKGIWDYELIVHEIPLPEDQRTGITKSPSLDQTPSPENPSTANPSTDEPSAVKASVIDNKEVQITEVQITDKTDEATASPQALTNLSKHPAIQLIRSLTNRYPDKTLWPRIVEALGDTPDEQLASRCYTEWVGRGWNKMNLTWLFDWYKNGGPQLSAQKGNTTYAKTGTGTAKDHSAIVAGFRARTIE